jgi:hypothetical protein
LRPGRAIEELIQLAKNIRAARARGEETGLMDEEIAFNDALAENESARQVIGRTSVAGHRARIGGEQRSACYDWRAQADSNLWRDSAVQGHFTRPV